ncbi:uncharacterized protein LOC122655186 [Telopea speciosissima]|uniref:uncharacterized protein LOC122655186 n=1 Tax=Telopea speciosissima TaxID=54955 RepID=UPI001CC6A7CD|nr:uncharacterized protein LOC122655186 [Telopea speciosissima]
MIYLAEGALLNWTQFLEYHFYEGVDSFSPSPSLHFSSSSFSFESESQSSSSSSSSKSMSESGVDLEFDFTELLSSGYIVPILSHINEDELIMLSGLKNAKAIYQRVATTILHDVIHKEVEVYVDDMIVKSKEREGWGIDVIGEVVPKSSNGHEYILVVIDYFTKWVEAQSYDKLTVAKVAKFISNNIICRYEVPHEFISDQGSHFKGEMNKLYDKMNIQRHASSPYRRQTNGAVEFANKNIKRII